MVMVANEYLPKCSDKDSLKCKYVLAIDEIELIVHFTHVAESLRKHKPTLMEPILDVGPNEIKKTYLESRYSGVIIKYLNESDKNEYSRKLIREVMNLKDIEQNKNLEIYNSLYHIIISEPSKNYYSMVLQQCYGENLRVYLKNNLSKKDWTFKIKIATGIANGLKYIHKANVVHRALKNKETPVNLTPIDYKELYESAWSDDSKIRPSIEEFIEIIDINHIFQDSDYIPNVYLGRNNALASKKEACLFFSEGTYQTRYLFLTQNEPFIGRNESNHIIFDLGSESVIYVNGRKLEFRAFRTLEKDDLIKLGKVVFQYLPAGEYENRIDKLLPIYNTAYLRKSLENEFKNAKENKQNLSLLFFDLDHFGNINKNYSHEAGDYVLKESSKLIQNEYVRVEDIFARYGGEEFTILLNDTNKKLPVTLSIGVSVMNSSVEASTDLLNHGEKACQKAKKWVTIG
ncbi:26385_t:CDS:2, partial [Dentiscutata erythropus]